MPTVFFQVPDGATVLRLALDGHAPLGAGHRKGTTAPPGSGKDTTIPPGTGLSSAKQHTGSSRIKRDTGLFCAKQRAGSSSSRHDTRSSSYPGELAPSTPHNGGPETPHGSPLMATPMGVPLGRITQLVVHTMSSGAVGRIATLASLA